MNRKQTVAIVDSDGFLADYFGFEERSPQHVLTVTIEGTRKERQRFVADLRNIAAGKERDDGR